MRIPCEGTGGSGRNVKRLLQELGERRGLGPASSRESSQKHSDSKHVLKVQPARLVVELDVGCRRKRKLKENFSVFHLLNGKVGLLLTKREG